MKNAREKQISVIVPVYGVEKYLQKCVDSVLAQTFTDFELLLVDDGSPDGSAGMCDENALSDDRLITIHKQNGGVSAARNMGTILACGEFVTYIDSDDYVLPQFLEELMKSPAELVLQTAICIDENEGESWENPRINETINKVAIDDIERLLLNDNLNWTACKRFKRSIISNNSIRFCTDIDFAEDTLFAIQYALCCRSIAVENVANYRYVIYTTRETLSNKLTNDRLKVIKSANEKICNAIYPYDANAAKSLFYKRMSSPYQWAIDEIFYHTKFTIKGRYNCLRDLQKDKDFQVVISMDLISIDNKYRAAIRSKSAFKLQAVCTYGKLSNFKSQVIRGSK